MFTLTSNRINNLLIEEEKFLSGVREEAQQLQSELKLILSLLKDAEAKQDEAAVVREWILQTKDLAYDAGDVLESYAFKVGSLRRGGIANVLKRYSCILGECYKRHKIGLEIRTLKTRVSGLTKSFQDFGIRAILEKEGLSSQQQQWRRTYSHIEEDDFVGLESDVEMLTQHLVKDNEVTKDRAISISGMGGLGKTTIARRIYNHPNVKRYFDGLAWVCVSQQWQKVDILQRLLIKLMPQKRDEIEKWTDEELVRKLFEVQQQKKCLIVLDDIWSTDAWESIKHAFPTRDTSSKILLTTRNKDVAQHIDPIGFHHELRLLSNDESWELLEKKAFIERYSEDNTEDLNKMKELGRKMAEQCGGLPLAVVILGGILAKKHSLSEWKVVYGDVKMHLGKGKGIVENQIQKILALSYTHLPDHLKLCFLYLGSFSEDAEIDAMALYQLWFAEGIVSKEVGQVFMLNVAEHYLHELAERYMVNVKLAAIPKIGRFESCQLHDLMRELCLLKAEEENFLRVINYSSGYANEIIYSSSKVRRIVINLNVHDVSRYVPPSKEMAKHVRMLKFVMPGEYIGRMARTMKSQFSDFKMVRILFIENLCFDLLEVRNFKDKLLLFFDQLKVTKSVGTLIHLRYLSFKDSLFITLPTSLANLKHLQTLDLRGGFGYLPNILWTMSELRYLYLPEHAITCTICNKLRLDGLSKLEILENFDDEICEVKDLPKLTNLRVLMVIGCLEPDSLAIIIDFTSFSNSLQFTSIKMIMSSRKEYLPLVRALLLSRNIQEFSWGGPTGNLPKLDPNNCSGLVKLELTSCEIDEDPMEALEKLPSLCELCLGGVHVKEMICHTMGFPKLKSLSLHQFPLLENWIVEAGAMPNLSSLAIEGFPRLELLPDGLRFVKTLKELAIEDVSENLKNRIQVSGEDFEKISHVPLVVIK